MAGVLDAIKPSRIDTGRPLDAAFGGNLAQATAARFIVEFCRHYNANTWFPFNLASLRAFVRGHHHQEFSFNGLDRGYLLVEGGVVLVREEFVLACYNAAPAG